jgi:putative ABC transport system ATP-binding protein
MLEISNIARTFNPGTPNEVRALRGISLRLETGSFLVIIGTNGSGKSTLLNAVAGSFLLDAGSIHLAGSFRILSAAPRRTCPSLKTWRLPRDAGSRAGWAGP